MSAKGFEEMKKFYKKNNEMTLGVGKLVNNVWYPIP
jgi:hypothetical protein